MKILQISLAFLIGIAISIPALYTFEEAINIIKGHPWVKITFQNDSNHKFSNIIVEGRSSTASFRPWSGTKPFIFYFYVPTEDSLIIKIETVNGKSCIGRLGYSEPGYNLSIELNDIGFKSYIGQFTCTSILEPNN